MHSVSSVHVHSPSVHVPSWPKPWMKHGSPSSAPPQGGGTQIESPMSVTPVHSKSNTSHSLPTGVHGVTH